jgi:hypothetical protein
MRSKKSNSTRGKGTRGSRRHGQDGSDKQKKDMRELKKFSKTGGMKTVRVPDPNAKQRASFPSDFGALRKNVTDNFCYRIPSLVLGPNGEDVPMPRQLLKKRKEKEGRKNRAIPEAYTVVVAGQPDIDAGVDGWIVPDDTDDFVARGDRMDSLLETFSRVGSEKVFAENAKGERVEVGRIPRVKNWWAESSKLEENGSGGVDRVKANATTVSMRDTIGVSPYISRALQRMIEDGFVEEARQAAEATMEPFGRFYEGTFRGPKAYAKVTSLVGHAELLEELPAGHFHFDAWVNATFLTEAETGVNREVVPARCWDAKATCHFGPGPGVTFWTRHLDVLGDLKELAKDEPEAAERAGYTKMLCDQSLEGCKKRSVEAYEKALAEKAKVEAAGGTFTDWIRPPDDFARDIRIHRELDRIFSEAIRDLGLEKDYVALGKAEYKAHLIEAYNSGETGIRMDTPEDLAQVAKVAERAEKRAREATEANERVLEAIKQEKEAVALMRQETDDLVADVKTDKIALKAALAAAEEAQRVAEAARDEAIKTAQKEAAPIFARARVAEEAVPKLEEAAKIQGLTAAYKAIMPDQEPVAVSAEGILEEIKTEIQEHQATTYSNVFAAAELSGVQAAFAAVLPGQEPIAKTATGMVAEIATGIKNVRDTALTEVAKKEADLEVREEKLEELQKKAGLWDQIQPLLDRVLGSLVGAAKESFDKAKGADDGRPLTKSSGWAAALVRVSQVLDFAKLAPKTRTARKKEEERPI